MISAIYKVSSNKIFFRLLEENWKNHTTDSHLAAQLLEELNQLKHDNNKPDFQAILLVENANFLCNHKSNYLLSLKLLQEADELFSPKLKIAYTGYFNVSLGKNYLQLGEFDKAGALYETAIQYFINLKDLSIHEKRWLGSAYYNLHSLKTFINPEYSNFEFLQKALDVFKDAEYLSGLSNCYNNMARIYFNKGDYEIAITFLKTGLELLKKSGNKSIQPIILSNIGLTYEKCNKPKLALKYIKQAVLIAEALGVPIKIIHAREKLAESLMFQKNYDDALKQLKIAESLALEIDAKKYLTGIYQNLIELFVAQKSFEQAHHYDQKYIEILRQNFTSEKSSAIDKVRFDHEAEKKELEASLINTKKEEFAKFNRKLEYYNDELNQFNYVTSHHLREPLRTITTYVRMLERSLGSKLSKEEEEYMHYITSSTKSMYELLRDFIAFSNISSSPKKREIKLAALGEKMMLHFSELIQKKNATIINSLTGTIFSDPEMLFTILETLISNSIKFNKSQAPEIIISSNHHEKEIEISLSDNGIGIQPEFHEKVFMIFERLHNKDEYEGTGIGLAVCKKLVDLLNGKIIIKDSDSGGSCFTIYLPQ